ncbi:MAG: hypothetical protein AAGA20_14165 [Planctomycetota bacterium]
MVNRHGGWAVFGQLDDGKKVIVKNGQPLIHEDELPPELGTANFDVAGMEVIAISSRNRVLWRARMDQVSAPVTIGYFVDRRPFLITQQTVIDGFPASGQIGICASDEDGVYVGVGTGYVSPNGIVRIGVVFPLDQSDVVCTNGPNSLGQEPIVTVHGSPWLADGTDFEVLTQRLPADSFALSLASTSRASVSDPAGSVGDLCLGGTLLRSGPLRSSALGTTRAWLSQFGGAAGASPSVGQTWYFQTWYRDASGGGATSRWTEAVSLQFL